MSKAQRNLRDNALNLVILSALLVIGIACGCPKTNGGNEVIIGGTNRTGGNTAINTGSNKGSKKGDTKADTSNKKSTEADVGDFQVEYVEVQDAKFQKLNDDLRKEKVLEAAAKDLNNGLSLPYDITLVTKDCGKVNAFYDPGNHSVTMCYELLDHFYKIFKASGSTEQEAQTDMFDAAQFVFLHEIGHALIDAYDLPVVGKEEDAADGLSTFICLEELKDKGTRSTIAAAELFNLQGQMGGAKDLPFYDEHSLDQQRFYNLLCSLYGSNPSKYGNIVTKKLLPEPRAVRCPSEYQQLKNSWTQLLAKYRKQ